MKERHQTDTAEINRLWEEYQQTKQVDNRDKIIAHYLPLVKLVAGRIAIGLPSHVDKEDLVSNGFFGLLDAIERYDPMRGIKFETYAVTRVRGAILDAIRAQDWVPATIRQKARQYEQTVAKLETDLGRSASDAEISEALGITIADMYNLLNQLNATTLIPLEEFTRTETVVGQPVNPSQYIEEEEVKAILAKNIAKLPEKEKLVVSLYYHEELTLKEISRIMNLTEARISQLHTKAIFRLRGALARIKAALL